MKKKALKTLALAIVVLCCVTYNANAGWEAKGIVDIPFEYKKPEAKNEVTAKKGVQVGISYMKMGEDTGYPKCAGEFGYFILAAKGNLNKESSSSYIWPYMGIGFSKPFNEVLSLNVLKDVDIETGIMFHKRGSKTKYSSDYFLITGKGIIPPFPPPHQGPGPFNAPPPNGVIQASLQKGMKSRAELEIDRTEIMAQLGASYNRYFDLNDGNLFPSLEVGISAKYCATYRRTKEKLKSDSFYLLGKKIRIINEFEETREEYVSQLYGSVYGGLVWLKTKKVDYLFDTGYSFYYDGDSTTHCVLVSLGGRF